MPSDKVTAEMVRHARHSNSAKGIRDGLATAQSELAILPDSLDADPWLLNVLNVTIDLRTCTARPHNQGDYLTKISPVEYLPDAKCPTFDRFLARIMPDPQTRAFVQRWAGYCLTGDTREQVLPIFYGTGANGKSTLLTLLLDVLGDYATSAADDLLTPGQLEAHPTSLADLHGRRLLVASETECGARLAESRVKALTGGETIKVRRMREDFWEMRPTAKIVLQTNHRPKVAGTDHAIWRRIRLVPFGVTIEASEQDKELPAKLRAEASGILNWLLAGCQEWQQHGLGTPKAIEAATNEYRDEQDTLGDFLKACCVIEQGASVPSSELLSDYITYTDDHGMTAKLLANRMTMRGFKKSRVTSGPSKGCVAWLGVKLAAVKGEG